MNKEKLKVLIDSIKTANEMMRKQIEINGRAVELLGEFITEPKSLGKAPHSHIVPNLSGQAMVGQNLESEVKGEYQEIPIGVVGKDGKVDPYIKPENMKTGEWYVIENIKDVPCLFLFSYFICGNIHCHKFATSNLNARNVSTSFTFHVGDKIRKATQEEILKYFPNELEVPTHGGNDAGFIDKVTDEQL